MQKAEIAILRQTQIDFFGEEFALLREAKPLSKSSKLNPLCPIIDEDGLLRLDSRIKHMKNVDYATTSPIILDGRHPAVRLLIRHYHVEAAHAFNELVINELKQRFWILRCRSEVRMVARKCAYCLKRKATPHIPPTGDIPDVRLEHHKRPFTNTGLDYFGPVEVTIGRRREKRWIALFTCMTTRAVHLEIVASLSANSAIMSIRRFTARRGLPNKILSDNGTSFVGANRQLCEFYSDAVQDFAANKHIEWCFIPPASPFMGGCWERLVKTVKTALLVTLKERAPREELLHTLLLEAEALVNSRPLTYVTENREYESLTPSHFLIGTSSPQQLPAVLDDGVFSSRKEWQKVLRLSEHFWTRWLKEYLPSLKPRRNDGRQCHNLKLDDVVLVVDPDLPRGVWPIGRIVEVFPGRDGITKRYNHIKPISSSTSSPETPRQCRVNSAEHINVVSPSNRSRVSSSRSSATIKALRLNEKAQLARRSLEREQQLFEREQALLQLQRDQEVARQRLDFERKLFEQAKQVEELEIEARLATQEVDGRSNIHTVSQSYSRTASWVRDVSHSGPRPADNNADAALINIPPTGADSTTVHVRERNLGLEPCYIQQNNVNNPINPYFSQERDTTRQKPNTNDMIASHRNHDNSVVRHNPENHEMHRDVYRKPVTFQIPINDNSNLLQTSTSNNNKVLTSMPLLDNSNNKECQLPSNRPEPYFISQRCSHKLQLTPFSENLVRLSGALRGQALESVSSLLYTAERPEQVLDVLEQTFALPEMIVLHEITLVRNLPKLSFDQKDLNNIACRLRNCIAVIRNLDQIEHIYSVELFHSVLAKLTPILYSQWKEFAYKSDRSVPKIQLLSEFLDIEAIKHNRYGLVPDYARRPGTVMPDLGRRSGTFMPELGRQTGTFTSGLGRRNGAIISESGRRHGTVGNNNFAHKPTRSENIHVTSVRNTNSELCRYCNNKHKLTECEEFKSLTLDDKWIWLREAKICSKCLVSKSHRWKSCRIGRCGVDGCERFHHPLLHSAATPHVVNAARESPSSSYDVIEHKNIDKTVTISNVTGSHSNDEMSSPESQVFLRVIPVEISGPHGKYDTYALLDDGSMSTMIDWEVARHIGATGPMQSIKVDGACGMSVHRPIQHVSFSIKGKQCSETFTVNNAKAVNSLSLFTQTVNQGDITKYSHLADLADVLSISEATPKVLLGAEHWYLTICRELREGAQTDPIATRTVLGWVLHGKSNIWSKPVYFINHISSKNSASDTTMDELVKDYFRLDAIGISKSENVYSNEDKHALEVLESTAKRLPSGRFEAGLLWRNDIPNTPDSYPQALSRFYGLERRMARESNLKKDYCAFIDNMMSKGYTEECPKETYHDKINTSVTHKCLRWYLPHFPVIHPQKRKLRVVHDAAAKTSGVSLNSLLLPGPDLLQSLLHILFRFREGHVAMTADVKEMFPQIRIRQEDRDALRFLWRNDPHCQLKEYRMTSVIFGAVCSPCTALYIKNRNAQELQRSYPAAAKAIVRDHYMDDYLGSLDSVQEAAQLAADIVTVHKAAGMEMRGWVSNVPAALAAVPENLRAPVVEDIHVGPEAFVRTLGLIWHPKSDTFSFRTGSPIPDQGKLTKRKVLSYLMCVYDPLGLLTPLVIKVVFYSSRHGELVLIGTLSCNHMPFKSGKLGLNNLLRLHASKFRAGTDVGFQMISFVTDSSICLQTPARRHTRASHIGALH
ncbi:uncharacterized protein LOC134648265 [Cydia amplana]|uniref:uncharacterized protein LOC134648265 n=1 Tax=Cydia amplana TaxID=1869771 RepID=UPI002FE4FCB2